MTTHHSNISCQVRDETKLGTSTSLSGLQIKEKEKKDVCEWKLLKRNVPFTLCCFFFKIPCSRKLHVSLDSCAFCLKRRSNPDGNSDIDNMNACVLCGCFLKSYGTLGLTMCGRYSSYQNIITFITKERLGSCGVHVNTSIVDERGSHKSKSHVHLRSGSFEWDFFRLSQIHWCHFRSQLA